MSLTFTFFTSFAIGIIPSWAVIKITQRKGWVNTPLKNRWNKNVVSLHGGVAILVTYCISFFIFFDAEPTISSILIVIILPIVLASTGLLDDIYHLSPLTKLLVQVVTGGIVISQGLSFHITNVTIIDGGVTLIWIIGITNAVNLMDNMDGAAAGICFLILIYLSFIAGLPAIITTSSTALAGALAAFLIFNFNPAKIFMGDSGSLFLGFLISILLLKYGATDKVNGLTPLFGNFVVPVLIFSIPIMDTTLVTINRLAMRLPIYQGDRGHITHRLSYIFKDDKISVLVLYLFQTIILCLLYFEQFEVLTSLLIVTVPMLVLLTKRTNRYVWPKRF